MKTLHAFIYFPENIDDRIDSLEVANKIIKDFQMTLDLADCETASTLYYSKANKDAFFANIQAYQNLIDLNIGAYDFEAAIDVLFADNGVKQIEDTNMSGCEISTYISNTKALDKNLPNIFYDIVVRTLSLTANELLLMINFYEGYFSQNPILLIMDCGVTTSTASVAYVSDFLSLDKWLQDHRSSRTFNKTDKRHIEKSSDHRKDPKTNEYKSPLLGGIGGRLNAEKLLATAIGDKRNDDNKYDLVEFDNKHGQYIWYEYEGDTPQNQYHGYHLVEAFSYERDDSAVNRISKRIMKIIEYRIELGTPG